MNSIHPRQGTEFDWIATDIDGKIALMPTAGFGSCPINESKWMDIMDQIVENISTICKPPTDDLLTARTVKGP